MSRHALVSTRTPRVLFTLLVGVASPPAAAADARVGEPYGQLPLHFEANRGQTHAGVRFLSRGAGYELYLTPGEAVLVLARPNRDGKRDARSTPERRNAPAQVLPPVVVRMAIVDAAPAPLVSGFEELPGKANYFIGPDPARWRTNVPTYAKVHYRDVYPGIDLLYYGNQRRLEYDFIVAPGADPQRIVLSFRGVEKMEIDAQGDLVLHAAGGVIRQRKPYIYQQLAATRREIDGGYVRKGTHRVGFRVAAYDASRPLIIDPVLSYSTYLGGSGTDAARAVAVDGDGNAYVAGHTDSIDFPTAPGVFQPAFAGAPSHAFVTKLNPIGSRLVYSTYFGGSGYDFVSGIAVNPSGQAYVTGQTSSVDFPTTPGAFQPAHADGGSYGDAFVALLDSSGSRLVYSTYLGGRGGDSAGGIAVDADGNAYVTGVTGSRDLPTTLGAFQPAFAGGQIGPYDAFVAKLDPAGTGLVYCTYLGGSGDDVGHGIAVDALGNAYIGGDTTSTDYRTTRGAFQSAHAGGYYDAFVTKLNATGSGLVYSTYLGGGYVDGLPGAGIDSIRGIAVDARGNAYVTGVTGSPDFPTTPGAFQSAFAGGSSSAGDGPYDAFVTKLNGTGSRLLYSTYLGGGSGNDYGSGIAVDTLRNAYVVGYTSATDYPTRNALQEGTGTSGSYVRAFVTRLNRTGSGLVYSTYLGGGSGDDYGFGIAVSSPGNAYVTGFTASAGFPTTPGAFRSAFAGGPFDAFVARIVRRRARAAAPD